MSEFDLNISIGGRYKLLENFSENLMFHPESGLSLMSDGTRDAGQSLELEFDSTDSNVFYFSSSEGLFKLNRRNSTQPVSLDTQGLGSPTALSISDKGYLLAGFSCGSIAIYDKGYTAPLTIWYNACKYAITQIKWCLLYFHEDHNQIVLPTKGATTEESKS